MEKLDRKLIRSILRKQDVIDYILAKGNREAAEIIKDLL